ncbi:MAG: hypothetical protein QM680_11170 [Luteolibacter sp.]
MAVPSLNAARGLSGFTGISLIALLIIFGVAFAMGKQVFILKNPTHKIAMSVATLIVTVVLWCILV